MASLIPLAQERTLSSAWARSILLLIAASFAPARAQTPSVPAAAEYEISLDARKPVEAQVRLSLRSPPGQLVPARDGDGRNIGELRCVDGRPARRIGHAWASPVGCTRFVWKVAFADMDAGGLDASLPAAAYSLRHNYWLLPERDGLVRASSNGGSVLLRLRLKDGETVERRYMFPSNNQPPFYAVIGRSREEHSSSGFTLRVFGDPPDYEWMSAVHNHVLASWARWRRDLVRGGAPDRIDWAWVQPPSGLSPAYNASAGAEAIVSQIRLREGDPDGEAKARVVIATSAAHEGFHTITGAAGQAWPAWVNESLANHYAIEAARTFLVPEDHRWLEAFYIAPDVRAPLLEAQARYSAGDGDQAQVFYTHGARFWNEIERVLTNQPNGSGRLAALVLSSNNFAGVDLNDADSLSAFLDRHSASRARPIVRCFLLDRDCDSRVR